MTDNEESIRQVMDVLTAEKEEYVKNAKARIAALDIGFAEKEASLEKIKKSLQTSNCNMRRLIPLGWKPSNPLSRKKNIRTSCQNKWNRQLKATLCYI